MKDIHHILSALKNSSAPFVLATVVKTTGSTYRRAGARALIHSDGSTTGLISGGCLERDLFERAQKVFADGMPCVITYDTEKTNDVVWGLGLGCPGKVYILLELIPKNTIPEQITFIANVLEQRERAAMATLFSTKMSDTSKASDISSQRVMLTENGTAQHSLPDKSLAAQIIADCHIALDTEKSFPKSYSKGVLEAFIEFIHPPLSLIIFGAGADAVPVVRFAKELGWSVSVVDSRESFLSKAHFPEADALLQSDPGVLPPSLALSPSDFALVMTHNYEQDFHLLTSLLSTPVQYIGLLGPRSKSEMMCRRMREEQKMSDTSKVSDILIDEERLNAVHNPAGLDLGTETPEEIALSIIAEIKAVSAKRKGAPLRTLTTPIHG